MCSEELLYSWMWSCDVNWKWLTQFFMFNSFPSNDRVFCLSVFSLMYGRRRYYTSSERVLNIWIKTRKQAIVHVSRCICNMTRHQALNRILIKTASRYQMKCWSRYCYRTVQAWMCWSMFWSSFWIETWQQQQKTWFFAQFLFLMKHTDIQLLVKIDCMKLE